MNIHEYQAKALFEKFGVPVPKGAAARSAGDFDVALASLPEGPTMVKSQIHAGGRGKGTFTDGYKGGVKFTKSRAEAKEIAGKSPLAVIYAKRAANMVDLMPQRDAYRFEQEFTVALSKTEDVREARMAFLEKRAPVFKGR